MNRRKSRGSRPRSYLPQDLNEACRRVLKEEMNVAEAAESYRIPHSTIWYNVYVRSKKDRKQPKVRNGERTKSAETRQLIGSTMTATTKRSTKELCCFCGIGNERELELGKLYTEENISVHYYCLLFSSALPQNGDDNEGIMGFLPKDLEKEIQRGRKLPCCYCYKKGATIGCSEKKCRRTYHYPCGIEHFALCRFTGDFRSYCSSHRAFQKGKGNGEIVECPICMEELMADPKTAIWAPCCKRKSWFHKLCLQRLALSAGYFFKCPLCNDKDRFTLEMRNVGIFIPEKDASWELEPNAFSELLERPIHCDALKCKCPDGRKHDEDGSRWEILLCNLCGSTGVHVTCGGLPFSCVEWTCSVCADMVAESMKRTQQEVRERRLRERRDKIKQSLLEDELTSLGAAVCKVSSRDETGSVGSDDCSSKDSVIDTGVVPQKTPCKRKQDIIDRYEETPPKICYVDNESTVLKLTYASDSDDEIDVESGECQVPPHLIIREAEEHGEELPKQLQKLKNYAVRAQERMMELRLTETEMVKMAKDSSQYKEFPVDKSDIMRFYRYSLPLERMLQILKLIKAVFALREAAVAEVQASAKKRKKAKTTTTPRGRKSRIISSPGNSRINFPSLKNSPKQTVIATGKLPVSTENLEIEEHENASVVSQMSMQNVHNFEKESEDMKEGECITDYFSAASSSSVSACQSQVTIQTLGKYNEMLDSIDCHEQKTTFKDSSKSEVEAAASQMSESLSTRDKMTGDQDIAEKENTDGNQKNKDSKGINQEACRLGACRKLSLVPTSSVKEPEEDDRFIVSAHNFSDRFESILTPKPVISNSIVNELLTPDTSEKAEPEKCKSQKLVTMENFVTKTAKLNIDGKSLISGGEEKLNQPLKQPFKSDKCHRSEPTKKKSAKMCTRDTCKYIQKTLSPFFLKNKNVS